VGDLSVILRIVLSLTASYLLGGFLGGALVAQLKGFDLRRHGSGNLGTTNVLRTMGPLYAIGTLLIDVAKGIAAVLLARWTGLPWVEAVCGVLVVVGHDWPLSADFRGGKGIATTLGTLIILAPKSLFIAIPVWFILTLSTGFVSLGSIAAVISLPAAMILFYQGPNLSWLLLYAVAICLLGVFQHRENIRRLVQGTENSLWRRKKVPS